MATNTLSFVDHSTASLVHLEDDDAAGAGGGGGAAARAVAAAVAAGAASSNEDNNSDATSTVQIKDAVTSPAAGQQLPPLPRGGGVGAASGGLGMGASGGGMGAMIGNNTKQLDNSKVSTGVPFGVSVKGVARLRLCLIVFFSASSLPRCWSLTHGLCVLLVPQPIPECLRVGRSRTARICRFLQQ